MVHHGAHLENGRIVTYELIKTVLEEVLGQMRSAMGSKAWAASKFEAAAEILKELSTGELQNFLTTSAYSELD